MLSIVPLKKIKQCNMNLALTLLIVSYLFWHFAFIACLSIYTFYVHCHNVVMASLCLMVYSLNRQGVHYLLHILYILGLGVFCSFRAILGARGVVRQFWSTTSFPISAKSRAKKLGSGPQTPHVCLVLGRRGDGGHMCPLTSSYSIL